MVPKHPRWQRKNWVGQGGGAYKWLRRFNEHGLEVLKDHQRSGRPPKTSEKRMHKIKQKAMENPSGWQVKQVIDLICKNTGYQASRSSCPQNASSMGHEAKGSTEKVCQHGTSRGKSGFQKRVLDILSKTPKGFTVAVQDESTFMHDILVKRKLWLPKGVRPVVTVTGSHQKTCVFGTLTMDGKQLFSQYNVFNQDTFLDQLKQIRKMLGRVILFTDRARQHRSKKVRKYLEDNKGSLRIIYLPKGSPRFEAVEECWRHGKYNLLASKHYSRFTDLKSTIPKYYGARRFNLDIVKYLLRYD